MRKDLKTSERTAILYQDGDRTFKKKMPRQDLGQAVWSGRLCFLSGQRPIVAPPARRYRVLFA
jgi:enamine deaminase RidA (YjgF/YER057c/UK114 family)